MAFAVIGAAFLAVTGGEALYADMGHFGPFPIRLAWFGVALPALTLNYFGQGALLLIEPAAIDNPFYELAPESLHYGLVVLATVATIIAAQAIISGAFSLTQQAIRLGFLPRMNIIHTAGHEMGQIYIPLVNWSLAVASIAAVIGFGSSHALAGAYGIAVSLLMVITTLLATFVALHWKHDPFMVYIVNGSFLALDLVFFASASTKLLDGGLFPLGIALIIVFLMLTWRKGEEIMDNVRMEVRQSSKSFIEQLNVDPPFRIPGSAVVLGRMMKGVPLALTHNLKVNHVLHQKVFLVAVETTEHPRVSDKDRVEVTSISDDVIRVVLRFGFMEQPDVPDRPQSRPIKWSDRGSRPRVGHLLYWSRNGYSYRSAAGDGPLAGVAIRLHASQRSAAGCIFQDSERADHGNRDRVSNLNQRRPPARAFGGSRRRKHDRHHERPLARIGQR